MVALVACGLERATHLGLVTGNANNKYLDRATGTLGTVVQVTGDAARTGSYGLRIASSSQTGFCGFANNGNGGVLGTSAVVVKSFWFRIPNLPAADAVIWEGFGTTGGGDMFLRFVQSTGIIRAEVGASTVNGPTISANTWYHVDLRADFGVNPHTLDWRVDEVAQTQVSAAQAAEQIFIAGWGSDNVAQTVTFDVDDIVMSITSGDYPFGKHKVVQLVPDTGGAAVEIGTANATRRFTGNATADGSFNSADILAAISEVPPTISSSASGVCQVTTGTGNAVGIPMTSYTLQSGETVTGLRVVVVGWAASTTAAAIGLRTFNGTTETTLFTAADPNFDASTTAPAGLCKMATLANFDTQTELDALVVRLGFSGDVSPIIGAHAVYGELAVKTVASLSDTVEQVTETSTVQPVGKVKTKTTGVASETGTAQSVGRVKTVAIVGTAGTGTALPVVAVKSRTVTQVTETSIARPVTTGTVLGQPAETGTAQPINAVKTHTLGLVTETGTAFTVVRPGVAQQVGEVSLAQPVVPRKTRAMSQAVETVSVLTVAGSKTRAVTQVTEASTVLPVGRVKTWGVGQPSETSTVTALTKRKARVVGFLTETDTAVGVSGGAQVVTVQTATETNAVHSVIPRRVTRRPDTGTTARSSTGTTARPFTGTTPRP